MSNKFIDSLKHVIIEDDDPKPQGHAQTPAPQTQVETAAPTAPGNGFQAPPTSSPITPPMGEETEHVYEKILAKTNFENTQVAATIHKYLDPLVAIPSLDERTRFKTAVIQAKAQEGLTQEKILATFDGLKVALKNEQESFASSAEAIKQQEIVNRQKKVQEINDAITQKQKEITQLQQRLSEVAGELAGSQSRVQRAEAQFAAAAQRRAAEIDQEKAKYVGLLQG